MTEAPRRRRMTTADHRLAGTLLGDNFCCWIDVGAAVIEPVPLRLADGREVKPGDRVTELRGKRSSAGYTSVRMLAGEWLTYLGKITNLDGTLVLFDTRVPKTSRVAYWLHDTHGPATLFHFTPACSGRVVETTHWQFSTP